MPEIPDEAVQAAARALAEYYEGPDGEVVVFAGAFRGEAAAVLEAAAPILAEHIARQIEERGLAQALDCWCHTAYADLAREAFPPTRTT